MANFGLVDLEDASGVKMHGLMDVDGCRISTFGKPPEVTAKIIRNIINLKIRDDDVMFWSGGKSGTHWGFEIISMLLNGTAESVPLRKVALMLENTPESELEKLPSPRVLNSHLPMCMLPKQIKEKKTKIILMMRNPKDVSVSFYHHIKGMKLMNYDGKFADFLPLFLKGQLAYGDWFDLIQGWEKEMNKGENDIHLVYFEDLKENGVEEIKKIAKFLGIPKNDELCQAICDKCSFKKLSADKAYPADMAANVFKGGFSMFRKGEIGDWKNHFTVAMNEDFDTLYQERMKNSKLQFRFTPRI